MRAPFLTVTRGACHRPPHPALSPKGGEGKKAAVRPSSTVARDARHRERSEAIQRAWIASSLTHLAMRRLLHRHASRVSSAPSPCPLPQRGRGFPFLEERSRQPGLLRRWRSSQWRQTRATNALHIDARHRERSEAIQSAWIASSPSSW